MVFFRDCTAIFVIFIFFFKDQGQPVALYRGITVYFSDTLFAHGDSILILEWYICVCLIHFSAILCLLPSSAAMDKGTLFLMWISQVNAFTLHAG